VLSSDQECAHHGHNLDTSPVPTFFLQQAYETDRKKREALLFQIRKLSPFSAPYENVKLKS